MNPRTTLFAIPIKHQRMLYVCARHKHLCYSTMPLNTVLRTGQVKCHAKYVENTSTHSILTGDAVGALVNPFNSHKRRTYLLHIWKIWTAPLSVLRPTL